MKKRIFDLRLYRDAMKQGKMIGLTALIILLLEAILIPVGNVIEQARWAEEAILNGWDYNKTVELVGLLEIHPLIIVTFCVVTPLLLLYMFSFLTKRNACDFYHAIPQTRSCLFLSFFGAAMTWVLIYTWVPSLVGAGLCTVFTEYFAVNWSNVLSILFNITAANLLVAASIAIAVSLTGTTFTNIIVSGIIIFVPRIFLTVVTMLVTNYLPMVPSGYLMPLLDVKYNVVFGVFGAMFIGGGDPLTEFGPGLYTLALGVLYTVVALWMFNRRRSESAGQAAASRKLQLVYRLVVSMLVCLIPCSIIFGVIAAKESMNVSEIYLLFVIYVVAVVVYFLYELITTRKWRNLVKAVPGLGILAIMNFALIGGMCLLHSVTLNTTPEAEKIAYVKLVNSDDPTYFNNKLYEDYFAAKTSAVELKSEAVREMVSERLEAQVEIWKSAPGSYYSQPRYMDEVVIEINTGMRSIYRYIFLGQDDWAVLTDELEQQEAFRKAYMELPAIGTNATAVQLDDVDSDAAASVYSVLRDEVAGMDFADWYVIAEGSLYGSNSLGNMTLATAIGSETFASAFPILPEMKKTAEAYVNAVNAGREADRDAIIEFLENWETTDYSYMNIHVQPYKAEFERDMVMQYQGSTVEVEAYYSGLHYYGFDGKMEQESEYISWEDMVEGLLANKDKAIDPNGQYGWVSLDLEALDDKEEWKGYSYKYYFNLEDLALEEWLE